jgi:hypothetical protein
MGMDDKITILGIAPVQIYKQLFFSCARVYYRWPVRSLHMTRFISLLGKNLMVWYLSVHQTEFLG